MTVREVIERLNQLTEWEKSMDCMFLVNYDDSDGQGHSEYEYVGCIEQIKWYRNEPFVALSQEKRMGYIYNEYVVVSISVYSENYSDEEYD